MSSRYEWIKALLLTFGVLILFPSDNYSNSGFRTKGESDNIERLADLSKLWGYVKYFHPSLAYRTDIDWDRALVEAIPKVRGAKNNSEYQAALQEMLDVLNDPLTKVSNSSASAETSGANRSLDYRVTEDRILLVTIGNYFALANAESQKKLQEITNSISGARAIVFDLRSSEPIGAYGNAIFGGYFGGIERLISTESRSIPGERRRVYYGYSSPSQFSSGQYRSGFFIDNGSHLAPLQNSKDIPSVFILNNNAGVFRTTAALQMSGKALVVFDSNDVAVGQTMVMSLTEGLTAQIRVSDPIFEDGTEGNIKPDLIAGENTIEKALEIARNFRPSTIKRQKMPFTAATVRERPYAEMKYPSVEYRLLAAFRIWNVIRYFYPYTELIDRDWNDVLREFIPKFLAAKNASEYTLTVAEMVSHIHDSHAYINSTAYNEFIGTGYPPIRVRLIENKPIVTALTDEKAARTAGVEVGDEVITVDREDAKERLERIGRYLSASTTQSRMDKATLSLMSGKPDSVVTLKLRDRNGKEKPVKLTRKYEDFTTLYHRERTGDIVRMLPGNIGYADLDRLTPDQVDGMFESFKETKAIVFDMRGYPNGTVWSIAPRLTDKQANAALFETPLVGHNMPDTEASAKFFQRIPPTPAGKWLYKGKTVMLIDERAASQAEHTGLHLRAANGTAFVGSRTAGVNGEIVTFTVPGAITIGFTGQSVRFPDGKQLQRIGLVPDVEVKPTVKGISAKRDEVLERAIRFINETR